MSEFIQLQLGNLGNNVGSKFYDILAQEHGITKSGEIKNATDEQLMGAHVFFNETSKGKYVPRAILADFDSNEINKIKKSDLKSLFPEENMIYDNERDQDVVLLDDDENNSNNSKLIEKVLEKIRKETEKMNNFNLLYVYDPTDIAGSGLSYILKRKIVDFSNHKQSSEPICFPISQSISEKIEPEKLYNFILTHEKDSENSGIIHIYHTDAISSICKENLKISKPTIDDISNVAAIGMSEVTSPFRFQGEGVSYNKYLENLKYYPRGTHFTDYIFPIATQKKQSSKEYPLKEIINQIFNKKNVLSKIDISLNDPFIGNIVCRGNFNYLDILDTINNYKIDGKDLPYQLLVENLKNTQNWAKNSAAFTVSGLGISNYLKNISDISQNYIQEKKGNPKYFENHFDLSGGSYDLGIYANDYLEIFSRHNVEEEEEGEED